MYGFVYNSTSSSARVVERAYSEGHSARILASTTPSISDTETIRQIVTDRAFKSSGDRHSRRIDPSSLIRLGNGSIARITECSCGFISKGRSSSPKLRSTPTVRKTHGVPRQDIRRNYEYREIRRVRRGRHGRSEWQWQWEWDVSRSCRVAYLVQRSWKTIC